MGTFIFIVVMVITVCLGRYDNHVDNNNNIWGLSIYLYN